MSGFPKYRINESHKGIIYYGDFREFIYSMEIEKQKGYSLHLSIAKHLVPRGDVVDAAVMASRVDYCLKWTKHLIQKVIQDEASYKFMRITDRDIVSHCAICDDSRIAFIASAQKPGHESLSKSLVVENTTSNALGFQRRARQRKRVEDITRDDCFTGWNQHLSLLRAMKSDIQRFTSIPDNPFMSQNELNGLRKRTLKMGIKFSVLQEGKPGIRIAGIRYHSYKAADMFLSSLAEEHHSKVEPGYSVFMDRAE